jgi:hypothetical protein
MRTTRRGFVALLAALPALRQRPRGYGAMDVYRWQAEGHMGKRVLCDGEDITDRCDWFNDETGEARVFRTEPPRIVHGVVERTVIRGRIEVRP